MGGVETAFMSTSLDRSIAENFATSATDKGKASMVFHIQMGCAIYAILGHVCHIRRACVHPLTLSGQPHP
jgi:hypothetical protein|eukprot:6277259-Prymnesium_polylepis.3